MKPTVSASSSPRLSREGGVARRTRLPNSSMSTPFGDDHDLVRRRCRGRSGRRAARRRSPPPRRPCAPHGSRAAGSAGSAPSPRARCRCRPPHPPRRRGSRRPAAWPRRRATGKAASAVSTGEWAWSWSGRQSSTSRSSRVRQRPDLAPFAERRRRRRRAFGVRWKVMPSTTSGSGPVAPRGAARSGRPRPSPAPAAP